MTTAQRSRADGQAYRRGPTSTDFSAIMDRSTIPSGAARHPAGTPRRRPCG
jgi:hypothetical protein